MLSFLFFRSMEPPNIGHSQAPLAPPWSQGLKLQNQAAASPFDYVKAGAAVCRDKLNQCFVSHTFIKICIFLGGGQSSSSRLDPD